MNKRILAVLILCCFLIVSGGTIDAQAADHTHKFSYWGDQLYNSSTVDHHRYYDFGKYKNCDIVGYYYRSIERCGCGKERYSNYWMVTKHMQCGK